LYISFKHSLQTFKGRIIRMEFKKYDIFTASLISAFIIFLILIMAVSNVSASISPNYINYNKEPNDCYTENTTVEVTGSTIDVDVMFSFDLSNSTNLSEILNAAKSNISQIMTSLIDNYAGVSFKFGVISYSDYPAYYSSCEYKHLYGIPNIDYAYSLDQPLTNTTEEVVNTIENLILLEGWDLPEDYTRIFYESYTDTKIGWRHSAQKLLVNFGDSVPHDCNLNEGFTSGTWSTGADPGPDGIIDNEDDLDLQTVLAAMNSNEITLIECHSSNSYLEYWNHWTGLTGGSVILTTASNFFNVVEEAITNELAIPKIYDLYLEVTTEGYEDWLSSVIPEEYAEVEIGSSVTFEETVCVPDGTPEGVYTFVVSALDEDGVNYGDQTNEITVIVNDPPDAPINPNPDDGETGVDLTPSALSVQVEAPAPVNGDRPEEAPAMDEAGQALDYLEQGRQFGKLTLRIDPGLS